MKDSPIEWTHHTFNPWWGCVKVSPACRECYAWKLDAFVQAKNPHWGQTAPRRFFGDEHWAEPLRWNAQARREGTRYRVMCGSMCDVMEDAAASRVHFERDRLYDLVERTEFLDWLFITKRPENLPRFLPCEWLKKARHNVWLLVSVEQQEYTWRIERMFQVPSVVYGVSYEPALGPVDFAPYLFHRFENPSLDWIIAGGESGPKARPPKPDWFRQTRDQCVSTRTAFFFKQWGHYHPDYLDSHHPHPVGKTRSGRLLDGAEWSQIPEAFV